MQRFHVMPVKIGYDCLQGVYGRCGSRFGSHLIGLPLLYMQILFCGVGIVQKSNTYVIETFQRTYGSCSYRNGFSFVRYELLQRTAIDGYVFRVHFVPFYLFAFDGLESPGSYVQRQFFRFHSFPAQSVQNPWSKVQSGGWSGYRAFYFGINGLVGFLITFLCLPVQIRRDRQLSKHLENIGECYFRIVPTKIHPMTGTMARSPFGSQGKRFSFHNHFPF